MKLLVTGGAGFIGSNLVQRLMKEDRVTAVRVLDNLETGRFANISAFKNHGKFEFIESTVHESRNDILIGENEVSFARKMNIEGNAYFILTKEKQVNALSNEEIMASCNQQMNENEIIRIINSKLN